MLFASSQVNIPVGGEVYGIHHSTKTGVGLHVALSGENFEQYEIKNVPEDSGRL